jgi:predicted metalloprotease with PDZ domain
MELQGDWLGLTLTSPSSMAAQQLGLPGDAPGVAVTKISPEGSPAAAVGVTVGDVIVGVSGKPVSNLSGLYTLTTELASAQPLTLDVMRRGQPVTVVIQPNAMPMAGMATMQPGSMQPGSMQPGSMQPGSMQPGSMQGVAAPWTGQPVAAMPPTVPAFPMAGPNPIPQSTW